MPAVHARKFPEVSALARADFPATSACGYKPLAEVVDEPARNGKRRLIGAALRRDARICPERVLPTFDGADDAEAAHLGDDDGRAVGCLHRRLKIDDTIDEVLHCAVFRCRGIQQDAVMLIWSKQPSATEEICGPIYSGPLALRTHERGARLYRRDVFAEVAHDTKRQRHSKW